MFSGTGKCQSSVTPCSRANISERRIGNVHRDLHHLGEDIPNRHGSSAGECDVFGAGGEDPARRLDLSVRLTWRCTHLELVEDVHELLQFFL
jgi:hypothetical protein